MINLAGHHRGTLMRHALHIFLAVVLCLTSVAGFMALQPKAGAPLAMLTPDEKRQILDTAEERWKLAKTAPAGPWKLEIATIRSKWLLHAPVIVSATLTNTGSKPATLSYPFTGEYGRLGLHVTGPDGKRILCGPPRLKHEFKKNMSFAPLTIAPHQALHGSRIAFYNRLVDDFAFPKPGRYQVQALMNYWLPGSNKILVSNTITLEIVSSQDNSARELFESIAPIWTIDDPSWDPAVISVLQEIAAKAPDNEHAQIAQEVLDEAPQESVSVPD
jgi:hypothetical protein